MSMGPSNNKKDGELTVFKKVNLKFQKITEEYLGDPIHYLANVFLFATMFGLFFGMKFSWQYYLILFLASCVEIYKELTKKKKI